MFDTCCCYHSNMRNQEMAFVLCLTSWHLKSDKRRAAAQRSDSLCQLPAVTAGLYSLSVFLLGTTVKKLLDQFPPVCQLSDLISMATVIQSSKHLCFQSESAEFGIWTKGRTIPRKVSLFSLEAVCWADLQHNGQTNSRLACAVN